MCRPTSRRPACTGGPSDGPEGRGGRLAPPRRGRRPRGVVEAGRTDHPGDLALEDRIQAALPQLAFEQVGGADVVGVALDLGRLALPRRAIGGGLAGLGQRRRLLPLTQQPQQRTAKTGERAGDVHDPIHHARKMSTELTAMIDHMRHDVDQVDEPQFKAMFETAAEVMGGLVTALRHYEQKNEHAWSQQARNS